MDGIAYKNKSSYTITPSPELRRFGPCLFHCVLSCIKQSLVPRTPDLEKFPELIYFGLLWSRLYSFCVLLWTREDHMKKIFSPDHVGYD